MGKYNLYMHIFPNNKVYIGITSQKPKYRWGKNGKGYAYNQRRIFNAIKKYGWGNVKHKILFTNLTKEEAELKEIELIAKYKSNNPKYGYNIENGGHLKDKISTETRNLMKLHHKGMLGKKLSEERKKEIGKISKLRWTNMNPSEKSFYINKLTFFKKGQPSWNKGKKMSNETRKKMSELRIGRPSPNKGKKLSKEHKMKLSVAHKGIKFSEKAKINMKKSNANAKKIICIEKKEIYNSGKECAEKLGCHRSNPNNTCNGKQKTCKGYHLMWLEDYLKNNIDN